MRQTDKSIISGSFSYAIINLIVYFCSIVAISIQTKLLPLSDFGQISVLETTVSLIVSVCTLGLPQAYVRFYTSSKIDGSIQSFNDSYNLLLIVFSVLCGVAVFLYVYHSFEFIGFSVSLLFSMTAGFNVVYSSILAIIRAKGLMWQHALYAGVGALLAVVLPTIGIIVVTSTKGYVVGWIVQIVYFIPFYIITLRNEKFSLKFNKQKIITILLFSLPLFLVSFGSQAIGASNKLVINSLLGQEYVAQITAAQKLGQAMQRIILYPLNMILFPMYIRVWETKGKELTEKLLSNCINGYIFLAIPMMLGASAVMDNIILLLMKEEYLMVSSLSSCFVAIYLIFGLYYFLSAGLFIMKRTLLLGLVIIFGAVISLVSSYLIVSYVGFKYVFLATMIGYAFILITAYILGKRTLRLYFDIKKIIWYTLTSFVMVFVLNILPKYDNILVDLIIRVLIGIITYGILNFKMVKQLLNKMIRNH